MSDLIPMERIENRIFLIRGQKVMLDYDLAELYGIETKQLKRQVRRNIARFPDDFMLELTKDEYNFLRCQFGTLKRGQHPKYLPYAFTEHGIAMLSSVLNSERAVQVNIAIVRAFMRMRQILSTHKELIQKINELEGKFQKHDTEIQLIFKTIRKMIEPVREPIKRIGFKVGG